MATRSSERTGLAAAVREVTEHAKTIARLEVGLALREIRRKSRRLLMGAGLLAAAAFLGILALVVGIAAGIAAIALVLPAWAALLVVLGGLLLLSGLLGTVGIVLTKTSAPPVPEQAIREAKLTTEALKNGHH